jgi:hypothetical protein
MRNIILILILLVSSCQKPEIAPVDHICKYVDIYTGEKCQENGIIVVDNKILCQNHYNKLYNTYNNTTTSTNTTQTYEVQTNNNYNCQGSSSVICGAKTKKNSYCKNRTLSCNGRCYLHGG